jgi:hypothetical protein
MHTEKLLFFAHLATMPSAMAAILGPQGEPAREQGQQVKDGRVKRKRDQAFGGI